MARPYPSIDDLPYYLSKFPDIGRLRVERDRSEIARAALVLRVDRRGEHDDRDEQRVWSVPDPFEHIEPVDLRHDEVKKDQIRDRVLSPIVEGERRHRADQVLRQSAAVATTKPRA